jgi:hypothetical protein
MIMIDATSRPSTVSLGQAHELALKGAETDAVSMATSTRPIFTMLLTDGY